MDLTAAKNCWIFNSFVIFYGNIERIKMYATKLKCHITQEQYKRWKSNELIQMKDKKHITHHCLTN